MSNGSTQWIAGINAVSAAIEHAPAQLDEVLIDARARNPRLAAIAEQARAARVTVRSVATDEIDRRAAGARHQGVVASQTALRSFDDDDLQQLIEAASPPLLLVLDGVQDPHNLGACLRSAAAAGVTAVVAPRDRAVGLTPTVRKVAAGGADRVPFVQVTNLARALKQIKDLGVWTVGLAGEVEADLYGMDLRGPMAIVMGSESEGMRRLTREHCDFLAHIPMHGGMESLNVSVAAGIALFEVLRQRRPG